jgi:dTDP-4-dehydrorhamnose 3,5-epimerase
MIFTETALKGAYVIDLEVKDDARGFFARTFCRDEFAARGLDPTIAQVNISSSTVRGTVRGMHYQAVPAAENKLVRCTRGAVFDVVLDLRADSVTHQQWVAVELSASNHRMVYLPQGCAHGFQTLTDDTEICYHASARYAPELVRGVRFDDPAFGIRWPVPVTRLSPADRSWPDYRMTRPRPAGFQPAR